MYQNPKYDLKFHYRKALELSAVISLSTVIVMLMIYKKFDVNVNIRAVDVIALQVEDVPFIRTVRQVAPPRPPVIPVESLEIDPADDVKINIWEGGEIEQINPLPPSPPENELPVSIYIVEIVPTLIGGEQAIVDYITNHNLFPEIASKLGISGAAQIGFTVNTQGIPEDVYVMGEKPVDLGFGTVGMEVIRAMRFTPGKQRDKLVKVKMQQTIRFTAQSR